MKMQITGMQFRECLAHISCMGVKEFEIVFGEARQGDAPGDKEVPYQWHKFDVEYKRDVVRWVCYLDLGNLATLTRYLTAWVKKNNVK